MKQLTWKQISCLKFGLTTQNYNAWKIKQPRRKTSWSSDFPLQLIISFHVRLHWKLFHHFIQFVKLEPKKVRAMHWIKCTVTRLRGLVYIFHNTKKWSVYTACCFRRRYQPRLWKLIQEEVPPNVETRFISF